MGFWHHDDGGGLMTVGARPSPCSERNFSEMERHYARLLYARQPGNADPRLGSADHAKRLDGRPGPDGRLLPLSGHTLLLDDLIRSAISNDMRYGFLLAFGLVLPPWPHARVPQAPEASHPLTVLQAIESPQIAGEIDPPAVIAVGQAEIRPSSGARVLLLSANKRTCGVLIEGPSSITYRVRDRLSISLARRNAGRADGIVMREGENEITLSASTRGVAVWGWNLDTEARELRAAPGAALPQWLKELLESKLESNPGRDMLLSAWNNEPGYRWAAFHTPGDDFMLDVDPRPGVLLESLHRMRRLPRNSGPFSGRFDTEALVTQPIGKPWWQPPAIDFISEDSDVEVRHTSGNHVAVKTRSRFKSLRDGLRGLSLSLLSEKVLSNGELRPVKITGLTVDGAPAPYVHWRNSLLVLMPRVLGRNDSIVLETTTEGEILERPDNDTYWRLSGSPWYPRPQVGGVERAAFRISVETNAPFVPFAGGEVVQRDATGQARKVLTRLNGPMESVHVLAGTYSTVSDEADGARVHVSTYASARNAESKRVARIVHGIRGCLANWFGVPYPFQDLQVIEINEWGWGQAPPGIIFVTKEAFMTSARANTLDEQSLAIAELTSRGINERIAHEVAHAWFPHVAKVDRVEENWLSESLADYTSAVCLEQLDARGGKARFSRQLREWKYLADQIGKGGSIYLAGYLGSRDADWRDRQALLYARGPLVLHAIRQELARTSGSAQDGDRIFNAWLRSYIKNFTFRTAETRHLVGILNQITKRDWQSWFDRYVYGTETPLVN
jgi:hypothetical protein